jgi:hypothetical protein
VVLLAYLLGGREKNNSLLIPDTIEDRIDRVVAALNQKFGKHWVNLALNFLQQQMELTMPGAAALVNAVYRAEQYYGGQAGAFKKQAALRSLGV